MNARKRVKVHNVERNLAPSTKAQLASRGNLQNRIGNKSGQSTRNQFGVGIGTKDSSKLVGGSNHKLIILI